MIASLPTKLQAPRRPLVLHHAPPAPIQATTATGAIAVIAGDRDGERAQKHLGRVGACGAATMSRLASPRKLPHEGTTGSLPPQGNSQEGRW
jgi:hypothetical protein